MSNFNEADHPRDDDGKFTYKWGSNSSSKESNDKKIQSREDILYPTMKDKTEKNYIDGATPLLNGGVEMQVYTKEKHRFWNEIAVDHINNPALKKVATKLFGQETAENLLMSKKDTYLNTDYAKEHLIFKNYKELNTDLKNYFEKKITKEIGSDKLENTGGIYINAEHQSSKDLANALVDNQEFIKKVAKERKSLEAGNSVNTSIKFTDNNFHYAIGKADILDMHINKNDNLDLLVTDVYDFNDDKNASDLIKVGRNRQEKGEVIPYFYIYHVIIQKNAKLDESKKK